MLLTTLTLGTVFYFKLKQMKRISIYLSFLLSILFLTYQQPHALLFPLIFVDTFLGWILLSLTYEAQQVQVFLKELMKNSIRLILVMSIFGILFFALFPQMRIQSFYSPIQNSIIGFGAGNEIFPGMSPELRSGTKTAFIAKADQYISPEDRYWRGTTLSSTVDGLHWFHLEKVKFEKTSETAKISQKILLIEHHAEAPVALDTPSQMQVISENLVLAESTLREGSSITSPPNRFESRIFTINDPLLMGELRPFRIHADEEELLKTLILNWFRSKFQYSTTPGVLRDPKLSSFLLRSRKGYCEHFAASFSSIMRSFGIPSRVVLGYRGGHWNPHSHSYRVDQTDAHAWSEFWSAKKKSWVRVDPTLSLLNFESIPRINSESELYAWAEALWSELRFSIEENPGSTLVFICLATLLLLFVAFALLHEPLSQKEQVAQIYSRFCKRFKTWGLERRIGQGPISFQTSILDRFPEVASPLEELTALYVKLTYSNGHPEPQEIRRLKTLVKIVFSQVRLDPGHEVPSSVEKQ
jgi:hypothetical protein